MIETSLLIDLLITLSIGTIMGMEREVAHQKKDVPDIAGIRTFILIALLGFLCAYVAATILHSVTAFIIGFSLFILLIIAAYTIIAFKTGRMSLTTEIAATITFLLASLLAWDTEQKLNLAIVMIAVCVASLLAVKEKLHSFAKRIKIRELHAALKLAIISLVILPLLPNKNYTPLDIPGIASLFKVTPRIYELAEQLAVFNPFKIWLMVVFISGLGFIGYVLVKTIGTNKGIGMTSFLGGLVSSTAVTITLAEKSRSQTWSTPLALGIVLASTVMVGRIILEVVVIYPALAASLSIPLIAMGIAGIVSTLILSKASTTHRQERIEFESPFALGPALKFGLFFGFILALAKILHLLFGTTGVYTASLLAGLADVDAITITLATLARSQSLESNVAIIGITLAIGANMFVKGAIAYFTGAKYLARMVAIAFLAMTATGILTAFLVF